MKGWLTPTKTKEVSHEAFHYTTSPVESIIPLSVDIHKYMGISQ
jgi:hypothetical protein